MSQISLQNLKKSFGKTQVIHDLSIDVKDGELIVIVGPSGCGKSTLLRMVAGLEDANEGNILIDNKKVNELEPMERNIAMVFQNYALYPHMKVYDNMAFSLKLRGWKKDDIQKHVYEAAEILELTEYLERLPKALSGGQRQRVALGRAIVRKPKVFLFDEPLSNLDAKMRTTMRVELKKLHERLGATMIYVTHDQTEAMTLGDRICVMNDGELQQMDTPLEVYNHPENIFVAGFIGSPKMNFIKITADKNTRSFNLSTDSFNLKTDHKNLKHNSNYTLGIRPEHIEVTNKKDSDLIANVDFSEQLGSETYFYCKSKGINQLIVHHTGQYKINKGDELYLRFKRDSLHLFSEDGMSVTNN